MTYHVLKNATTLPSNRRRTGRLRCVGARCELGPILDISGSGFRVLWKRFRSPVVGSDFELLLRCEAGVFEARGRVVRIDRLGGRRRQVGLVFRDLTDADRVALAEFMRHSRPETMMTLRDPPPLGRLA